MSYELAIYTANIIHNIRFILVLIDILFFVCFIGLGLDFIKESKKLTYNYNEDLQLKIKSKIKSLKYKMEKIYFISFSIFIVWMTLSSDLTLENIINKNNKIEAESNTNKKNLH